MNSRRVTTKELNEAMVELLSSVLVMGAIAVCLSRFVPELEDKTLLLAGIGLAGCAAASGALVLLDRRSVSSAVGAPTRSASPLPAPSAQPLIPSAAPERPALAPGFASFTVAKIGSAPDENEDSLTVDEQRGLIAISDGASSSFGASVWSWALTNAVVTSGESLSPEMIARSAAAAAQDWTAHHTQGEVAWWAQEGLRRGAFATLLTVSIEGQRWRAIGVGDSCVLHLRWARDGWTLMCSFPVASAKDFGSHPDLLSSANLEAMPLVARDGDFVSGDVLIVATDAVAEWLLEHPDHVSLAIGAPIDVVEQTVIDARQNGDIVNDDLTFMRCRSE